MAKPTINGPCKAARVYASCLPVSDKALHSFIMSSNPFEDANSLTGSGQDDPFFHWPYTHNQPISDLRHNGQPQQQQQFFNFERQAVPSSAGPFHSGTSQSWEFVDAASHPGASSFMANAMAAAISSPVTETPSSLSMRHSGHYRVSNPVYPAGGHSVIDHGALDDYHYPDLQCAQADCPEDLGPPCDRADCELAFEEYHHGPPCDRTDCDDAFDDVHHGPPCNDESCDPGTRCELPVNDCCPPSDAGHFFADNGLGMQDYSDHSYPHECIEPCRLHQGFDGDHQHMLLHHHQHQHDMHGYLPTPASAYNPIMSPTPERKLSLRAEGVAESISETVTENDDETGSIRGDMTELGVFRCEWLTDTNTKTVCGRAFGSAADLQQHCKDEHAVHAHQLQPGNVWPCLWKDCSRHEKSKTAPFKQKSKLERHLQSHTGYKPCICHICGIPLSAKQALEQHMRIHTNEAPWKCPHPNCPMKFRQQSALTMHLRTHTGEKPLKCDICGKTFSESSNLSKHRRTHFKATFECVVCKKAFARRDGLERHMNSKHKMTRGSPSSIMSPPSTMASSVSASPPPMLLALNQAL